MNKLSAPLVFVAAFIFFYQIQFSTPTIPGFDGYYHIKFSAITFAQGLVTHFPWFPYSFWNEHFADHHFLYHVLLIPFTLYDLTFGAKLSTVFFFSVMMVACFELLKKSKTPFPWVWLILLALASHVFLYRLSLPRAPVIALAFLFIGQCFILGKNYKSLSILTVLFVWLYGGFTLFVLFAALMILSRLLIEKQFDHRTILAVSAGVIAGLVTHPYFPENIILVYAQTFSAGVNRVVVGGGEWYPYGFGEWLESHILITILFLSLVTAFACTKSKPRFDTLGWLAFVAVMFAMTLSSRRFIEYLIPAMVMACATLFRDTQEAFGSKEYFTGWTWRAATSVALMALVLFGWHQYDATANKLADPRAPDRYKKAALWIKEHGPGTVVFNTDWDDFPELFFYNAQNSYVAGLDPAFLYLYNKEMYQKWLDISTGKIKEDPYPLLKDLFKTRFLITDTDHVPFIELMERNPRIGLVYMDENARVYALRQDSK